MTTTIIKSSSGKKDSLPALLIKVFGLEEDQQVEVKKWGTGVLIKPIDFKYDKNKSQKATKKAMDNIRKGNVLEFDSTEDGIDYLES